MEREEDGIVMMDMHDALVAILHGKLVHTGRSSIGYLVGYYGAV
jgi:hypothetical protein